MGVLSFIEALFQRPERVPIDRAMDLAFQAKKEGIVAVDSDESFVVRHGKPFSDSFYVTVERSWYQNDYEYMFKRNQGTWRVYEKYTRSSAGCGGGSEVWVDLGEVDSVPDTKADIAEREPCKPYAGQQISSYGWQRKGISYGDPRPEALIDNFDDLTPAVQALFRNPSDETFDFVVNQLSDSDAAITDACEFINGTDPMQAYVDLFDSEMAGAVTTSLLSLVAIATESADGEICSANHAASFLNDFLIDVGAATLSEGTGLLHISRLSNDGIETFSQLILKYIESRIDDLHRPSKSSEIGVAAIQFNSKLARRPEDVEENIERIADLAREAARDGAVFIVTPELAIHGYAGVSLGDRFDNGKSLSTELRTWKGASQLWCHKSRYDDCPSTIEVEIEMAGSDGVLEVMPGKEKRSVELVDASGVALSYDSSAFQPIREAASESGAYIQVGYIEKASDAYEDVLMYNSVNVYGPDGGLTHHHRKTDLWMTVDKFIFSWVYSPQQPFFETPYGRIASAICYEGNSIFSELYEAGVETVLYSVAWVASINIYEPNYQMVGAKIREHPMNVVMANWAFDDGPKVSFNNCEGYKYDTFVNDAERTGSGLSYVMDHEARILNILTGNPKDAILHSSIPIKSED